MSGIVNAITGQNSGVNVMNTPQIQGATAAQAAQQYQTAQNAYQQQQALLQALQGQNGIQNQSNVFNQLQNVAAGQGPNPAQAMLAQSTGANVANQAALMAGQRGSNANVGLMARQAAQQGANTQQQAAGQAATLQAQQSLGALGQLGGLATQQVGQQQAATLGANQLAQNEQQNLLGSINAQNQAQVGLAGAQAGLAGQAAGQAGNLFGNVLGGIGAAAMLPASAGELTLAEGGEVPSYAAGGVPAAAPNAMNANSGYNLMGNAGDLSHMFQNYMQQPPRMYADGGHVKGPNNPKLAESNKPAPRSNVGKHFHGMPGPINAFDGNPQANPYAKGGKVPAMVSPGEVYLDRKHVSEVKHGKNPLQVGERIPGNAQVRGDSYANDTVPKDLEAGGIVIPRSVMQAKNAPKEAAKFVASVLARDSGKSKSKPKKK